MMFCRAEHCDSSHCISSLRNGTNKTIHTTQDLPLLLDIHEALTLQPESLDRPSAVGMQPWEDSLGQLPGQAGIAATRQPRQAPVLEAGSASSDTGVAAQPAEGGPRPARQEVGDSAQRGGSACNELQALHEQVMEHFQTVSRELVMQRSIINQASKGLGARLFAAGRLQRAHKVHKQTVNTPFSTTPATQVPGHLLHQLVKILAAPAEQRQHELARAADAWNVKPLE
jgi:hypothetical protein